MFKIIMVKLGIDLTLIEFEKTKRNTFKVYYCGVFLARQSLISLNTKVLTYMYDQRVFNYTNNPYSPDFFAMSYSGLVTSLRFMLASYCQVVSSEVFNK